MPLGANRRSNRMQAILRHRLTLLLILILAPLSHSAAAAPLQLRIADPFIELHTGPGRGYPIFHVIERGEPVQILSRRTDWYKLSNGQGTEGWAERSQLARTLSQDGARIELARTGRGDYPTRRFEIGAVGGLISSDAAVGARAGVRIGRHFGAEAGFTHIAGDYANSQLFNLNLVLSPLPALALEPLLSAGVGHIRNTARPTLVDGRHTAQDGGNLGLGLRGFLGRNLALRADLRQHFIRLDRHEERLTEATIGISAFF